MSRVNRNILANFVGKGWAGVAALVFTPVYLGSLGVETYGLIGIFVATQTILAAFDFGLSTALNRELARYHDPSADVQALRELARSVELLYWGGAVCIGVVGSMIAPWIAGQWIGARSLSDDATIHALWLMVWAVALQWPFLCYAGGLGGLQKQVALNKLIAAMATVRWGGAAVVVLVIPGSVESFFAWQMVTSLVGTWLGGRLLWQGLGNPRRLARIQFSSLHGIRRFAAAVWGTSAIGILLSQLDKIVLSKLLSLQQFAYYSLAATVATVVYIGVVPVVTAVFPRLTELLGGKNKDETYQTFHRACRLVALLVLPLSWTLAVFSNDIIELWTHSREVAQHSGLLARLIVMGTMLNALLQLPYALLLAYGNAQFWLYVNVVSLLLLVPALFFLTIHFGAVGAPFAWIALNLGYFLVAAPRMPIPRQELSRWFWKDVAVPFAVAGLAVLLIRALRPAPAHGWVEEAFWVGLAFAISFAAVFVALGRSVSGFLSGQGDIRPNPKPAAGNEAD